MKNNVKIISVLMSLLMIVSVFAVVPSAASAAEADPALSESLTDEAYPDFVYEVTENDTASIVGYSGEDGNVEIPSEIGGYEVTDIGRKAFDGCTGITSVTIPETVTGIAEDAFSGCKDLVKVTILDSPAIEPTAFSGEYLTFYGYTGTSVETYANEYAFSFVSLGMAAVGSSDRRISTSDEVRPDENAPEIELGETRTVNIENNGDYAFLKFVAETTASVVYTSLSNEDTYGYLYDEYGNQLESNDDGGSGNNFRIKFNVSAGETYYLGARFFSSSWTGSFDVRLTEMPLWEHDGEMLTAYNGNETDVAIPAELDGDAIKRIGYEAFAYNRNLKSVKIPNSVISIESHAFHGCTGLTSITIPESVSEINYSAFYGCTGLTSVDIPDSVTFIGDYAFYGCTGLTRIEIPASVTTIGNYAFYDCTNLATIVIPDSVTSIGYRAFENTAWYDNQPDGVIYVGKMAYQLKGTCPAAVTIKNGTVSINKFLFAGHTELTSITIPNSVTSIGYGAFRDCTNLATINIPDSVTSIGYGAFENTAWYDNQPDGVIYVGKVAYQLKGTCPAEVTIKNGTASINDSLFTGRKELTKITFPNSLTEIGYAAFAGCTGLTSLTIPASVTTIQSEAFAGCAGLTSVEILGPITEISAFSFSGCSNLKSITIPESVTKINPNAFANCSSLTSINIPEAVTNIAYNAFMNCSGLTSITVDPDNPTFDSRGNCNAIIVTETNSLICGCKNTVIPESVTSFGQFAFYGCTGLTSINIPKGVTSISSNAFYGCSGLTGITVDPDNPTYDSRNNCNAIIDKNTDRLIIGCNNTVIPPTVTGIGGSAFRNCTGLTNVVIPDAVTSIGSFAFYGCTGLTSIGLSDNVSSIGAEAFYGCTGLTSIDIPDSVTSITESVFYGCTGLTSVTIPDSVEDIGWRAFSNCPLLKHVAIPASVTYISENAFGYYYDNEKEKQQKVEGFTISGELGSAADDYARENGFEFVASVSIPEDVQPITLGETVLLGDGNYWSSGVGYLKFTPTEDMKVTFSSSQGEKAIGYLLNEDGDILVYKDGKDNDRDEPYFNINYEVTAGETYYLVASYYAYRFEVTLKEYTEWDYYVNDEMGARITRYNGDGGDVTIPSTLDDYPVREIGYSAFRNCTGLTSVIIPNSVRYIGERAFYNCTSLTNVTIPDSVRSIYERAFYNCPSLTSITIPDSVTSIGTDTFGYYYDEENYEDVKVDGFTVCGSYGSFAEGYAYENEFDFVATAPIPSEAITEVKLNETAKIPAEASSGVWYFKFTPTEDVDFLAGSSLWGSSYGYLYDSDMNLLVYDNGSAYGDDMFARFMIRYAASAGETYYLAVRYYLDLWGDGDIIDALTITEYHDWDYKVLDDGTAEITKYYGSDSDVIIPSEIDGYTVTSIGSSAFYRNRDLESVVIPDTVTGIGSYAFCNCSYLSDITIPDSITSVGYDAFWNTPWYSNLPDGLIYVGKVAYQMKGECPEEVVIKDGTVALSISLFSGYDELTSVTIPGSVTSIGKYAFSNCTGLTSIDIPDGVTSIGNEAFYRCSSLESISIPDSLTSIGYNAFFECTSLNNVTIPASVTSIGSDAFGYYYAYNPDGDYYYSKKDDGFTISGELGSAAEFYAHNNGIAFNPSISIPDDDVIPITLGETVTLYKSEDWFWTSGVGYLKFTPTEDMKVTFTSRYGDHSICYLLNKNGEILADSGSDNWDNADFFIYYEVTAGETYYLAAVYQTYERFDVTLKEYREWEYELLWGNNATITRYNGDDSEVTVPSSLDGYSITGIGSSAFRNNTELTSVTIPDSVTSIDYSAFYGCTSLQSVTIPDTVTYIGSYAFHGCSSLTSVTIPNSVAYINDSAFSGCTSLQSVTIPDSVESISNYAFYDCPSLTSVTIPDSVTSIDSYAFGYVYDDGSYELVAVDGFTIYGIRGSAAETYADENGFDFVPLNATPILGDADGNGQVTVLDATAVQYYLASLNTQADVLSLMLADVDRNGLLEITDVTFILRWLANIDIPYEVGTEIENVAPLAEEWSWPTPDNYYITSYFGEGRSYETHGGLDIGASAGTPVYAANAGTVVSAYSECTHSGQCNCGGGYGNYVWILHADGNETIYAHLSTANVAAGETVSKNQLIGYVGSSGWSTGPHLHFELHVNGVKTDPMTLY